MEVLKLILLAGSFQGFILAAVLFFRRNHRSANRIFACFLCLISFHLILAAFDEQSFFIRFPHLLHITWVMPLLYGPLVILFFRRISLLNPKFKSVELLFFVPFLVSLLIQLPFFLQPAHEKIEYINNFNLSVADDFGIMNQITNFFHLFFFTHAIIEFQKHKKHIVHYYSDISKAQMNWYYAFIRIIFVLVVFSIITFYGKKWDLPYLKHIYPYHFLGIVIAIYWTGYKALHQPLLFGGDIPDSFIQPGESHGTYPKETDNSLDPKPRQIKINPQLVLELEKSLRILMEKENWYLNSELTIQEVAEKLKTNKQYISEVINKSFRKNFYDFINDYRIEEFKRLAAQPGADRMNILGIAFEAGFNSKATFNAVFKKKTGVTPSEYIRQNLLKPVEVSES
jgi:AraC-like DNA-binding protein